MKRVFEYCRIKDEYAILEYFFNARGAELEKTPLGMLRSLLVQLLEHEPSLYDQLLPIFRIKNLNHKPGKWEWREPELRRFFLSKLQNCRSRPFLLIIDALDECSEDDVQKVAEFLQDLSTNATDAGNTLNICLSSRHYPFIRFKRYQELVLEKEKQHDEDIVQYISTNLTMKDESIEEAIREKSSGIFMWVVLVIKMLNRAYEDGKIEAMKQKLNEMPAELEKVFETILGANNPDKGETILILQWVLFAKEPLSPEEIYFAIRAGADSQTLSKSDLLQITPGIIRRRIISSSRGLIEIRKGKKETVQFIHKSVNDFLLRNRRLQILDPKLKRNPIAISHDRLKNCCMSYLTMESLESLEIPTVPKLEYEDTFFKYTLKHPFLKYASTYLFDHAEEATVMGQVELLRALKDNGVFKRVTRWHSCFMNYKDPEGAFNLLHIAAARGLPKLITILLKHGADINAKGKPHGTALEAAIYFRREKAIKTLLNEGARINSRGGVYSRTTLHHAIYKCDEEILVMLFEKGAKLNVWENLFAGNAFHQAILSSNKDVIAMMLDKGANVNTRGFIGNALSFAAAHGEKEILQMLLEKGADVDDHGIAATSLMAAAAGGDIYIVDRLLKEGANIHVRRLLGTVLTAAAFGGNVKVAKMFLEKGVKINAQGVMGTALVVAAYRRKRKMVKMLLNQGAEINARGIMGTSLTVAAYNGDIDMARMLLHRGADINICGGVYGNALNAAVVQGHKEVVEILLRKGANINARGLIAPARLLSKLFSGSKDLPEFIEKGIRVSSWRIYGTALQAAKVFGEEEIVQLLLEKGARA